MIVYTAKVNKKKLIGLAIIAAVIIAAIIVAMPRRDLPQKTSATVKLASQEDVLTYVNGMGYEVNGQSAQNREVTIPKKFDDVYEKYNALQKENGYDLSKYKGKKVDLYTYEVTNHPESANTVIELLVYKNKPIGGSIYTKNLDGFMYGLKEIQAKVG